MSAEENTSDAAADHPEQADTDAEDSDSGRVQQILETFANKTTIHGLPRAILGKSIAVRCLWATICISAFSMFGYQLSELMSTYLSYPVKVTTTVVPTDIPSPQISFANMAHVDLYTLKTIADELNRVGENASTFVSDDFATGNTFVDAYLKYIGLYDLAYRTYKSDEKLGPAVENVFTRTKVLVNLLQTLHYDDTWTEDVDLVPDFNRFVVSSHLNDEPLSSDRYSHGIDPYYFHTVSLKPHDDDAVVEGVENGWSAIVLAGSEMRVNLTLTGSDTTVPGLYERQSVASGGDGVRVQLHPPRTLPWLSAQGYDVPPRMSASFAIRTRRVRRMGWPYGRCNEENPFAHDSFKEKRIYRVLRCQKMCLQRRVIADCGCWSTQLPRIETLREDSLVNHSMLYCQHDEDFPKDCAFALSWDCREALLKQYERAMCAKRTTISMSKNATFMRECDCVPPCEEVFYDVSYSLFKWPTNGPEGQLVWNDIFEVDRFLDRFNDSADERRFYADYFDRRNWKNAMKDFARVNVYLASTDMVLTVESPDYTLPLLISDIGGQLGVWIGMSVVTLSETLALFGELLRHFFGRLVSRRRPHAV